MPVPLLGLPLQSFLPLVQAAIVSEAVTLLALDVNAARFETLRLETEATT
jgi:hypothetical protein